MIKFSLFGLLVAASTSVTAQTSPTAPVPAPGAPTTTPNGTQPATPATPAQPADTASDTAAVPAVPATPATPATKDAAAPNAGTVQSTVDAEWASYDANSNSQLSRAEFEKWIGALQTAADGKAPTRGYLTSAFQKADADKSGGVSKPELVTFLGS